MEDILVLFCEDLSAVATLRRKNNPTELRLPTLPSNSAQDYSDQIAFDVAKRCLGMSKENVHLVSYYVYFTYRVFVATTSTEHISHANDEILDCGWMMMNMHINNLHSYVIYSSRRQLLWAGHVTLRSSSIWFPSYNEQMTFRDLVNLMEKEYPHSVILNATPQKTGWHVNYI